MSSVTRITPSYLYQEYNDDEDLQALVASQNTLAQSYLDWYGATPLPNYQSLSGLLLDWVVLGLYGFTRPVLPYGPSPVVGPYNTWTYNQYAYNTLTSSVKIFGRIGISFFVGISPIEGFNTSGSNGYVTSDDTFKRCITWNFYKGDGRVFNVRWLKRRIERFLTDVNTISETYDVSIIFGRGNLVNIVLVGGTFVAPTRAAYNRFAYNRVAYNGGPPTNTGVRGRLLHAAVESGVLQLPFQNRYVVYG